jgi:hypothetical protein
MAYMMPEHVGVRYNYICIIKSEYVGVMNGIFKESK